MNFTRIVSNLIIFGLLSSLSGCSKYSLKNWNKYESWGQTYWGMSSSEVQKKLDLKMATAQEVKSWSDSNYRGTSQAFYFACLRAIQDECSVYGVNNYKIGKENYNLMFVFTNDHLSEVTLICDAPHQIDENKAGRCYEELKYLLTQKYGKPTAIDHKEPIKVYKNKPGKLYKTKVKWDLKYSFINMNYERCMFCEHIKDKMLHVTYTPNTEKVNIDSILKSKNKNKI